MKKQFLALGVCVVVLIGLLAAYVSLGNRRESRSAVEQLAAEFVPPPFYTLLTRVTDDKIATFSLTSGGETLTFLPDTGSDTGWRLDGHDGLRLDTYYTRTLVRGITELGTERRLTEDASSNLAEYGLDPPQATMRVRYTDGGEAALMLGSKTPDGENYYIMREGDPAVYIVDELAGEKYAFSLDDLTDKMTPEIDVNKITYAYIQNNGAEIEIMQSGADGALRMNKPFRQRDIYLSNFTEGVLGDLHEIQFDELIEIGSQNAAHYGLDEPWLRVRVLDEENEFLLLVGGEAGVDRYYAKRGDDMIFTIDAALIARFRDADALAFIDRFVALVNVADVQRIVLTDGGQQTEIVPYSDETAASESEDRVLSPAIDGVPVDESAFRNWYQSLIGLSFDSALGAFDPQDTPAAFAVAYYLTDGTVRADEYFTLNDNFYAVKNDGGWFAVGRQSVNTVQRLLAGLEQ